MVIDLCKIGRPETGLAAVMHIILILQIIFAREDSCGQPYHRHGRSCHVENLLDGPNHLKHKAERVLD